MYKTWNNNISEPDALGYYKQPYSSVGGIKWRVFRHVWFRRFSKATYGAVFARNPEAISRRRGRKLFYKQYLQALIHD